jgi:hypothetical protein
LRDFDYYLRERLVFDTAGFCGAVQAVKIALMELPVSRIVFATDYPQEIRAPEAARQFILDLKELGDPGAQILSGNANRLLCVGNGHMKIRCYPLRTRSVETQIFVIVSSVRINLLELKSQF